MMSRETRELTQLNAELRAEVERRKQLEEKLRGAMERLELALEAACAGTFNWDMATGEVFWSDGHFRLHGYAPGEVEATYEEFASRVHPEDLEQIQAEVQAAQESRGDYDNFYRVVWPDRSVHWLHGRGRWVYDDAGQPVRMYGVVSNADERKATEARLAESEQRLRRAQSAGRIGTWEFDLVKNGIELSEEAARTLGTAPGCHDADRLRSTVVADDVARLDQAIEAAVFRNEPYELEYRVVRESDGETRWVHARGEALTDKNGRPHALIGTTQDITERKEIEAALVDSESERRSLERALQQAQKLEAVGTLASGIAHDFNNLLSVILGNLELATLDLGEDSDAGQCMRQIEAAVARARGLTTGLLTFSRKQKFQKERLDLGELVGEQIEFLANVLPASIAIDLKVDSGSVWVDGDAGQFQQVLTNLVVNARDAMPNGGRLRITVGPDPKATDLAMLEVADEGIGMDEETMARIFDPFFTTKPQGEGTGLGMAMIHGIVSAHDGTIELGSSPRRGTRIRIRLPAARRRTDRTPLRSLHVRGDGERILVVEDHDLVRQSLTAVLESAGYEALPAASPREARTVFDATHEPPDLVLMDIDLPLTNGVSLVRELRRTCPELPVIYLTGNSSNDALRERDDEDLVMSKPPDFTELLHSIATRVTSSE